MHNNDPMPLSIIEHYAYCPRQAALIHVEGLWATNVDTASGEAQHAAVDRAVRQEARGGVTTWLSLPVWSESLGVAGVCDAVEVTDGVPTPVEYKPKLHRRRLGPASQQLAAQAMCLEEMWGVAVPVGILFTHLDRRRHQVTVDADLRRVTTGTVSDCRELLASGLLPPPLRDVRCDRCSLVEACGVTLPDLDAEASFRSQPEGDW